MATPPACLGRWCVARLWAAVQGRARIAEKSRRPFFVTLDEAPRFVDQPTDLGDVLARSREYGVGVTLIGQSLRQFPESLARDRAQQRPHQGRVPGRGSGRQAAGPRVRADRHAGDAARTGRVRGHRGGVGGGGGVGAVHVPHAAAAGQDSRPRQGRAGSVAPALGRAARGDRGQLHPPPAAAAEPGPVGRRVER